MKYFHFISMDQKFQTKINNHAWTNFIVRHHQSKDELAPLLKLPSENFVFLDIDSQTESENIKNIYSLNQIASRIIVVSKDTAFAYNAIKAGVHDYVLKSNFIQDILSIYDQGIEGQHKEKGISNKIAIHCTDAVHYLSLNEIIRCQAESNYTRIITEKKTILIAKTLKKIEALLPPSSFYRTHRSHIINLKHVKMIRHEKGGTIVTSDDCYIPIARNRKSFFWDKIQTVVM